ncbi:aldo/keto reductase [Dysgonomonas sp. 511]|uniref:aldo/keto reductase n=1 Tax=Dysgonomonas sp. 511 TaxID=2302930 RepID=UPI0013D23822|nr:aldo/keto reductase [Dysgonomonas sp. 511]NDV77380.1 L-glyceraldehyde 3-phosphate reductase [Dysgonomonas sp. 511]
MKYNFCGNSGLQLPEISLGLWHNFGDVDNFDVATSMILYAFEKGVTHFDLANNYGPPPGSAETNFGKVLAKELKNHRDELIISSKAGHLMWDGPYGDGGSRKYIMASIDQSLKRTGLEYFDIFYSHRYDPHTPIEETMQALVDIVRQGKALYIGISKYPPRKAAEAYEFLKAQHVPCLIYQDRYSMFAREPEAEHMSLNERYGVGFIAFSPLAQGLLTNKYLNGIPETSRAHKSHGFLQEDEITPQVIERVKALNILAQQRGQTLAEMALAWLLQNKHVTSVIVGTSSLNQLKDNLKATENRDFTLDELEQIERILK